MGRVRLKFTVEELAKLHGFDYSDYRTKGYALLSYAMDHILTKKEGKKNFCNLVTRLEKAYLICKTSPSIYDYAHEFAFLSAVKAALQKQGASSKKLSIINNDVVVKSLISNALADDSEIIDILQETEKVSSDIGLLSEDFLKKIQELETKNLAVELLNKLLLNLIKSKLHTNNFQNMRFSELFGEHLGRL